MTPPGCLCARCDRPFHGHPARRAKNGEGWEHARWPSACDRAADLAFMADHGETAAGAAMRLGISLDALAVWCRRNDAGDLWDRLAERDAFMALARDKARGYYADFDEALGRTA